MFKTSDVERRCIHCDKKLKEFKKDDWLKRKYHKSCYNKLELEEYYNNFMKNYDL